MICKPRAVIPWNDHAYIVVSNVDKQIPSFSEFDTYFYSEGTCIARYIAYGSIEFYQIYDAEHGFVAHGPPLAMKVVVGWDGVRW